MAFSTRLGLVAVLPLLLLGLLVGTTFGDYATPLVGFHRIVIIAASLVSIGLGFLTLQVFLDRGRVADLSLALGLATFGAVYIWHGVYTGHTPHFRWLVYGPLSRIAFAGFLLALASRKQVPNLKRSGWALLSMVIVGAFGFVSWSFGPTIASWAADAGASNINSMRLTLEIIALTGSSVALFMVYKFLATGSSRSLAMLGIWFVMLQSIYFLFAKPWDATWWIAHAFGASGSATLALSVLVLTRTSKITLMKERHEHDEAMRQTFLNNAAHALRTPLTSLVLNLRVLQNAQLDDRHKGVLDSAQRSAARLRHLSDELLLAAAAGKGTSRLDLNRRVTDLQKIAKTVLASFEEVASLKGITLNLESVPCKAWVDAERVSDLLSMLVENAIQYTPAGSVTVSIQPRRKGVDLTVQDTGIGMTPEHMDQVFRPFSRPHERAMMRTEGNGLSLVVARGIAEAHDGVLEASSAGPGKGSRFRVRLPFDVPAEVLGSPAEASTGAPQSSAA